MTYCSIDKDDAQHLTKIIDFLYSEVIRSGGDGDALWYSEYYNVKDILPLIEQYNNSLKFKWEIAHDEERQIINWGQGQEGVIITNDEDIYKNSPIWQQCLIKL